VLDQPHLGQPAQVVGRGAGVGAERAREVARRGLAVHPQLGEQPAAEGVREGPQRAALDRPTGLREVGSAHAATLARGPRVHNICAHFGCAASMRTLVCRLTCGFAGLGASPGPVRLEQLTTHPTTKVCTVRTYTPKAGDITRAWHVI